LKLFLSASTEYEYTAWSIQSHLQTKNHAVFLEFIDDFTQVVAPQVQIADYVLILVPALAFQAAYQNNNPTRLILESAFAAKRSIIPLMFFEDNFNSPLFAQIHDSLKAIKQCTPLNLNYSKWDSSLKLLDQRLKQNAESSSRPFTASPLPRLDAKKLEQGRKSEEFYERGIRSYMEKNTDNAKASFDKAISLQADFSSAYNSRALCRRRMKDFEGALKDFDAAIRIKPSDAALFANRSLTLLDLKRYEETVKAASKAIELNPELSVAYNNRAQAYTLLGKKHEAVDDYQKAIALEGNVSIFHSALAMLLEEMYLPIAALNAYNRLNELDSNSANANKRRIALFSKIQQGDELKANYDKAIASTSSNQALAQIHHDRAIFYGHRNEFDLAKSDFMRAIKLDPQTAQYYLDYAILFRTTNQTDKALEVYQRLLSIDPKNAESYFGQADVYIVQKAFEQSMTAINQAIQLNSQIGKYYELRAILHQAKKDLLAAIADFTQAIALQPSFVAYLYRGITHADLQNFDAAIDDIKEAIKLNPRDQNAQVALMNIERMRASAAPANNPAEESEDFNQEESITSSNGLPLRMPRVDVPPLQDPAVVFTKAWEFAKQDERKIVILTPGRMMMQFLCPPQGAMQADVVQSIEQLAPSSTPLNVTVIANNDITYLAQGTTGASKIIPFLGYMIGFAYIGHRVLIFEGHSSALAQSCDQADMLILDEAMIPLLQSDWLQVALAHLKTQNILIFGRNGQLSFYQNGKFT
jgi:tetratricopeptide (TPR) repeat protein